MTNSLHLPGIGDYTASAVMSFAFGERIAVIDTNIRRVLSRVFLGVESRGGATSPAERALANRMLPKDEILGCDADVADNAGSAEHVVNSTIRGGNTLSTASWRALHRSRGTSR